MNNICAKLLAILSRCKLAMLTEQHQILERNHIQYKRSLSVFFNYICCLLYLYSAFYNIVLIFDSFIIKLLSCRNPPVIQGLHGGYAHPVSLPHSVSQSAQNTPRHFGQQYFQQFNHPHTMHTHNLWNHQKAQVVISSIVYRIHNLLLKLRSIVAVKLNRSSVML